MNKVLVLILTLTIQWNCFSQTHKVVYYDFYGIKTDSSNCYYSWSMFSFSDERDTIKSYYCNPLKLRSMEALHNKIKDGVCSYYYPNGQLKEKIVYKKGIATGYAKQFYPNGRISIEKIYIEPSQRRTNTPINFLTANAWDSLGNQTVKNNEGHLTTELEDNSFEKGIIKNGLRDSIWVAYNKSGRTILTEKYDQGEFVEGNRISGSKTIHYTTYEVSASPKGGLDNLYKDIVQNIRYPGDARKNRIQGKVFVKFIIEPDGSISNVEVVKGVELSIDNEATRVIKMLKNWNPGYQRGLPVRQAFTLPLTFKLS